MSDEGMAELRRVYPWAADEIERLRAEVQAEKLLRAGLRNLDVENDRLRAALDEIEGVSREPEVLRIARAALDGAPAPAPERSTAYTRGFRDGFNTATNHPPRTAPPATVAPDELWRQAVAWVREQYPEDVFPPDGTSVDSGSARMARLTCDTILRRHAQLAEDAREADQPGGAP